MAPKGAGFFSFCSAGFFHFFGDVFLVFFMHATVLGFIVSAGRRETTVSCDPGRSKTRGHVLLFPSVLFRTKSNCLALFLAFSGAQVCESRIHLEIKFGEQSFPKKNSISLNVSRSPIGFRQKAIRRSSCQLFRGTKASPFKVLKRSVG